MLALQEPISNDFSQFSARLYSNKKTTIHQPSFQFQQTLPNQALMFDGKRVRKSVNRKTVDYNSSIIRYLEDEIWERDARDIIVPEPDASYTVELQPPLGYINNSMNAVMTKFIRTATNKIKCPIFSVLWTPDGRRLITGASSGEFTLWNGLTFNFETILQAHDSSVRSMVWSHNDQWMITADHGGYIKYWQSNMNNVKMFQAHKEAVRGLTFSPLDSKFASCSDDGTLRIWDFERCCEEKILRGHGSDVKSVDWHPFKALIASGSKDNQQPVKLWDPRIGQSLATIHSHKGTVMSLSWNTFNGNWLITGSRDHSIKLYDIRTLREEVQSFKGHKKDVTSMAWHPIHEGFFVSGSADGTLLYWTIGSEKDVGGIEQAHDSIIWSLSWHPLGHILVSGSNDHSTKFWTRNRPGDLIQDKDNINSSILSSNVTMNEDNMTFNIISNDHARLKIDLNTQAALPQSIHINKDVDSAKSSLIIPGLDISESLEDINSASLGKTDYFTGGDCEAEEDYNSNKQGRIVSDYAYHYMLSNKANFHNFDSQNIPMNQFNFLTATRSKENAGGSLGSMYNGSHDFLSNPESQQVNRIQDVYHILNAPINHNQSLNSMFENGNDYQLNPNHQMFPPNPNFMNQNFVRNKFYPMNPNLPHPIMPVGNSGLFNVMNNFNGLIPPRMRNDSFHFNHQNCLNNPNKTFFGNRMFNLMNSSNRLETNEDIRGGRFLPKSPALFPRNQRHPFYRYQKNFYQRPS